MTGDLQPRTAKLVHHSKTCRTRKTSDERETKEKRSRKRKTRWGGVHQRIYTYVSKSFRLGHKKEKEGFKGERQKSTAVRIRLNSREEKKRVNTDGTPRGARGNLFSVYFGLFYFVENVSDE